MIPRKLKAKLKDARQIARYGYVYPESRLE
jgi:uncharacterized protein YlbG (UPF0298 family)